jgi:3-hydroxyisobutyrate dehydrogenase
MLGVGLMGSGMAGRLLSANFPLTIYNRNPEKSAPFAVAGAQVAGSPREAAQQAEIVISMVADDAASRTVWLAEDGAMAGVSPGTVLIECSTVTVAWIHELAAAGAGRGCELLDAPVTGTKPHAASGQLLFLVGGPDRALATAMPVLLAMGRDIIHFGPSGSGAIMKLINNFLVGVQAASLAEAMAFIKASGLDRDKALAVFTNGALGSPLIKVISTRASAGDFTPNFMLRLMAKDLGYALQEGSRHHTTLHTAASALQVFQQAIAAGYGEQDFSAVIEARSADPPLQRP